MTACNALGEGEKSCVCARGMCGEMGLEVRVRARARV